MDFLLCCPRGPDHQGRHAVPEAESAADGPPWAAGAEKERCKKGTYYNLCVMCLMAAFVPHRPNKYFHVTASNGIVSNSPYTPLATMDCISNRIGSGIRNCPRCRCRLATFAALPTPSMIERAIIILTDPRLWDMLLPPSSSGKTLPSFHP